MLNDQVRSWTFPTTGSDVDEFAYVANGDINRGISAYSINAISGSLRSVRGSPFGTTSDFRSVAVDAKGKFLFGTGGYSSYGGVYAFKMESSGALKRVAGSPFPTGEVPNAVAVEPSGRFAYVVNVGQPSSVTAYIIDRPSGALKPMPGSPFGAGDAPDAVAADPNGKFLYVSDYAGHDVWVYSIDAKSGALKRVSRTVLEVRKKDCFPQDLAIDPVGNFLYVTCPNFPNGDVSAFKIGLNGKLTEVTGSPFQTGAAWGVTVDPTGKFVYVTNYDDAVAALTIKRSGALTPVPGSPFPTGNYTEPDAVAVDPTGKFAYVADAGTGTVSAFKIKLSGALSQIAGSPFPSPGYPDSIAICRVHAGTGACLPRPL